jgi:hypothetical protein
MLDKRTPGIFQPHVFVGSQHIRDARQQSLFKAICDVLEANETMPVVVDHDPLAHVGDPLPRIVGLIDTCHGAIILAFNRIHIASGIEFPGGQNASWIERRNISAVWDHIEAAMAFHAGIPLLILQEQGLYQYGMVNFRRTTISFAEFSFQDTDEEIHRSMGAEVNLWCHRLAHQKMQTGRQRRLHATHRNLASPGKEPLDQHSNEDRLDDEADY